MDVLQSFIVTLPSTIVLNANRMPKNGQAVGRMTREIIERTTLQLRGLRAMDSAFIVAQVTRADRKSYDASNLHPTLKPITDAVVRAGLLPDDSNEYVLGPLITHEGTDTNLKRRGKLQPARFRFRVSFLDDVEIRRVLA